MEEADQEAKKAAFHMIERYGIRAGEEASLRVGELEKQGMTDTAELWRRIGFYIGKILNQSNQQD